jgi:hypothetical protein
VETSASFFNLRSLGKDFEYMEYSGHVGRWCGEDLVAVVVQDELVLEVLGPWWRWAPSSNPGIAALGILEIFFTPLDDFLVGPAIGAEAVAVKTLHPLLVVLADEGLGVQ